MVQPIAKLPVTPKFFGQTLVPFRERMTRIRIERAGQRGRDNVRHMVFRQPIGDAVAEPAKRGTIFLGHDVFVERADNHENVVAA